MPSTLAVIPPVEPVVFVDGQAVEPLATYGTKEKDLSFATVNDGQVMSSVVHGPTGAFMNRTCCPDQLQAVRDRGPGMWLHFMTGCLDPGSQDYGDCIMEAVVGVGDCDMPDIR